MAPPGQRIERIPIGSVTRHPENVRKHDLDFIEASLRRHGQYVPILVQDSTRFVIKGNGTHEAVQDRLGWTELDAIFIDVDNDEALEILLADNFSTDDPQYEQRGLADLLQRLAQRPDGLAAVGRDQAYLDNLLAELAAADNRFPPAGLTDPDAVPEPPVIPVTKPGDLWELGPHRLLCGDARKSGDYHALLGGAEVKCVVTDPPYGVAIGDKNAVLNSVGRGNRHEGPLDGDQGMDDAETLWRAAFPVIRSQLPPGTSYYVFGPQGGGLGELLLLLLLLREAGLEARHILVWVKDRPTFSLGRLDYEYQHEPICYGWTPGAAHSWYAEDPQSSILQVDRPAASKLHPTMKPVAVYERLVRNSVPPGAIVLDPFAGSGTAVMAAHATSRQARVMEVSPLYCDVICRRFQEHTGTKPIRDGEPVDFSSARAE